MKLCGKNFMESEIRVLDLFSGIGGFSLGLERAGPFRTVAFCEREPFPQAVLRKHWPEVPIYDDVRTIPTDELGRIDLICGGFPCQPWSVAGQQRGAEDDRDLWPVMASLIEKLRPQWVIGENVRGFVNEPMGLQRSLSDLESIGYETVPFIIPACAVDAPHRRDRVWIVAHRESDRREQGKQNIGGRGEGIGAGEKYRSWNGGETVAHAAQLQRDGGGEHREQSERQVSKSGKRGGADDVANAKRRGRGQRNLQNQGGDGQTAEERRSVVSPQPSEASASVADADGAHGEGNQRAERDIPKRANDCEPSRWLPEPGVGRVAYGVPRRVDRLKALGNAVVPQVVEQIGKAILNGTIK